MRRRNKSLTFLLVFALALFAVILPSFASMNVFLKDGRVITVPVSRDDIIGISFEGAPALPAAKPPATLGLPVREGLVMWLDADDPATIFQSTRGTDPATLDKQPVGLWRDKSGNENHFLQHRPEARPRLSTTAIGGKPSISFAPGQGLSVTTNFPAPTTVIYVAVQTSPPHRRVLTGVANNWLLGYWNGGKNQAFFEGWITAQGSPPTDNVSHIFTGIIRGRGQDSEIWADGLRVAAGQGGITGPNGLAINTGTYFGESSHCQVAEIIVFNRAISRTEQRDIEAYLRAKWMK